MAFTWTCESWRFRALRCRKEPANSKGTVSRTCQCTLRGTTGNHCPSIGNLHACTTNRTDWITGSRNDWGDRSSSHHSGGWGGRHRGRSFAAADFGRFHKAQAHFFGVHTHQSKYLNSAAGEHPCSKPEEHCVWVSQRSSWANFARRRSGGFGPFISNGTWCGDNRGGSNRR